MTALYFSVFNFSSEMKTDAVHPKNYFYCEENFIYRSEKCSIRIQKKQSHSKWDCLGFRILQIIIDLRGFEFQKRLIPGYKNAGHQDILSSILFH